MSGGFYHLTVFFFRELRLNGGLQLQGWKFLLLSLSDQICHLLQFLFCLSKRVLQIICHHPCDQKHLLSVMIKGNDLVKEH